MITHLIGFGFGGDSFWEALLRCILGLLGPALQVLDHIRVTEVFSLIHGQVAPAILGIMRHMALFQQELDALQVTLRCGQMEGSASIIIGQCYVHAGEPMTTKGSNIATGRGEEQVDNGETLGLVTMLARILLVRQMLQVVITMEIEHADQLITELKTAHCVAQCIQGGDHAKMPITLGMTSIMPPLTPVLAGNPTLKAN